MTIILNERFIISAGDSETIAIDYTDILDGSELLTGTPTVVEPTTSGVTLSNKGVNTAALTIKGRSVAIGKAVQCLGSGWTSGSTHTIRVTVSTDASPARTWVRDIKIAAT